MTIEKETELTLLFDGGCPLCQREVSFLRSRDRLSKILFVDINSPNYKPEIYNDISYREAMGRIHAINSSGEVLKDIRVFREAYQLVGLGWVYSPTTLPVLGTFIDVLYRFWARWRLFFTRRSSIDELCKARELDKNP